MSRLPRFFISSDQVIGRHITISGEDVRHIVTVLRMTTGDQLLLCDGKGNEYTATIVHADRSEIKTESVSMSYREIRRPHITLGQGLPKSDKMDWIVQKATELGVSAIVPLITERTIVKVRDEEKRTSRWQKICREAAMQSNRVSLPILETIRPIGDFIRTLTPNPETLLLLPWEEGTEPIKNVLRKSPDIRKVVVLVGPEGGFSSNEAAIAREKGFQIVSLGNNILRAETAAVAVLSMIHYEFF